MKTIIAILTVLLSFNLDQQANASHPGFDHNHHHRNHHSFELPSSVVVSLAHRYGHFDLIHINRAHHRGKLRFDLVLQHGSSYVSVSVGHHGHFYRETYHRYFPLDNHYCNEFCSFQYMHYSNGHFAGYDPYSGCKVHVDLMVQRYPRFHHRPYYGYGRVHYHPKLRMYKHFRHNHRPPRDYHVHNRGQKYRHRNHSQGQYGHRFGRNDHHRGDKHRFDRNKNHRKNGRGKAGKWDDQVYHRHKRSRRAG